ncbi:MAG TPA: class I SAM-dependent methyltransferase [Pirellulales bacterium]|nr:class I SAM-dependent methyltransferase [Pirellulales bacterium]
MRIVVNDRQLADINGAFDWLLTQRDAEGRAVGTGPRDFPLMHERLEALLQHVSLAGLRVLEAGCLEGHMTAALCAAGAEMTAFDARPICLLKTFARCLAFGYHPRLLLHDARRLRELGTFDLLFHCGVFYHLDDPVTHLREIRDVAPLIALDTHTAKPDETIEQLHGYEGHWYRESGWGDEQSGLEERSFWLTKPALLRLFSDVGFTCERLLDDDHSMYGPRSMYLLRRLNPEC